MNKLQKNPLFVLLINILAMIVAYYVSILLHEWGHGTLAWLCGVKSNPFNIQYSGWLLKNVDENVDYNSLINSGRGTAAALIGIAGFTVSFIFVLICFILINSKHFQQSMVKFIFAYWFLIANMIPIVQYLTIATFSSEGDTGRFIHGLNISGWWVFVPGTLFVIFAVGRILIIEIPKAYAVIPIKNVLSQNVFLLATLSIIFLFIYTHGYNPLTDIGMNPLGRLLAIFSMALVPILFIICNPTQNWVKKAIKAFKQ